MIKGVSALLFLFFNICSNAYCDSPINKAVFTGHKWEINYYSISGKNKPSKLVVDNDASIQINESYNSYKFTALKPGSVSVKAYSEDGTNLQKILNFEIHPENQVIRYDFDLYEGTKTKLGLHLPVNDQRRDHLYSMVREDNIIEVNGADVIRLTRGTVTALKPGLATIEITNEKRPESVVYRINVLSAQDSAAHALISYEAERNKKLKGILKEPECTSYLVPFGGCWTVPSRLLIRKDSDSFDVSGYIEKELSAEQRMYLVERGFKEEDFNKGFVYDSYGFGDEVQSFWHKVLNCTDNRTVKKQNKISYRPKYFKNGFSLINIEKRGL